MKMLTLRVMKIVLNFQNNEVPSVLCLYLVNKCLAFSILSIYIFWCYSLILCIYSYMHIMCVVYIYLFIHMLYKSLMAGRGSSSGRGRVRLRKYSLPFRTCAPPTTLIVLASTTPTTANTSTPPSHPPHTQEFVMIPKFEYVEPRPQPLFPPQPSLPPPPPLGGEVHTSPVPGSTISLSLASLVHRVPTPPRPPPHKAPRTSAWSLDMMINPSK